MFSHSVFSFCKLCILTGNLITSAQTASALTSYYANSSRSLQAAAAPSSTNGMGSFILHGLEDEASSSSQIQIPSQTSSITSSGTQLSSKSATVPTNGSIIGYSTARSTSKVTMSGDVFTKAPNLRDSPEAVAKARQCWSEILTWSSSSYLWYQASVANRVWPLVTSPEIDQGRTFWTSTYYPASPSVYTLCDGSPRANVRPWTTTSTYNTTYSTYTWTSLATPTFRPQPCTPSPQDCHIWYNNSGIAEVNEDSILKLCGNPVHGRDGQCVFGIDGAVELIYFPVKTANGSLCTGNASTIFQGPTATTGPNIVTYSGRTFTSGAAYISIKSLSAYYDGYGYTVGPNFSDFILTLKSEDVSTQCRGVKTSTKMNFADLNWPVPVSAYDCQMPCGLNQQGLSTPTECSTIWSDFNPLLAIPSQITDLSPLWATCKIDVPSLGNYWIDPPIALQEQHSAAAPTLPSSLTIVTTSAAPGPTPTSPAASTTSFASLQLMTTLPATKTEVQVADTTSNANGIFPASPDSFGTSPSDESVTPSTTRKGSGSTSKSIVMVSSNHDTVRLLPQSQGEVQASTTRSITDTLSFEYDPTGTSSAVSTEKATPHASVDPSVATAAGFSILTQALASTQDYDPVSVTSPGASSASVEAGVIVTLADGRITATQADDHFVFGSTTITPGDILTVSDTKLSVNSGGIVVGGSTFAASALPTPTATRTAYVIASGSFTLFATSIEDNSEAVQVGSATLSLGGPAVTVSGQVLTKASSGVVLVEPEHTYVSGSTAIPSVVDERPAEEVVLAAGGHTVTALVLTGDHTAFVIGGKTLSRGGAEAVIQGATFTVASGGLGVLKPHTSRLQANSTSTLPSVVVTSTPTSSRWSPSAAPASTSTSDGGVVEFGWARRVLLAGILTYLLYI